MESTHCFGQFENLLGVYCKPETPASSRTAVIMLTPGMLHHVGPMRLHVQLARRLAEQGIASLRFDLSGIGESLAVGSQGTSLQRAQSEVGEAMDWLRSRFGFEQFILFGLCSGADDALATAVHDDRVVGLSMLDGCGYRTPWFYVNFVCYKYLPKLLSVRKFADKVSGWLRPRSSARSMPMGVDIREYPERQIAESQLTGLVNRGVQMQFVYTGGAIDYYSYEDQFFDMFPSLAKYKPHKSNSQTRRGSSYNSDPIAVEFLPEADHLVMIKSDREALLSKLAAWMKETASFTTASNVDADAPSVSNATPVLCTH
jgi:pimeloyl-ACP methyl ester carboxylesterase